MVIYNNLLIFYLYFNSLGPFFNLIYEYLYNYIFIIYIIYKQLPS
jgi:hypothetical protein